MRGEKSVIEALNLCLKGQLTLINQTFLHARIAKNWGLEELNEQAYKMSIRAMKDADDLIQRILFLEGLPGLQALGRLRIGESVPEMLAGDHQVFSAEQTTLASSIALLEQQQDFVSRELLVGIQQHCEDYIDWLETQQWQIENLGLANYLAAQLEND